MLERLNQRIRDRQNIQHKAGKNKGTSYTILENSGKESTRTRRHKCKNNIATGMKEWEI